MYTRFTNVLFNNSSYWLLQAVNNTFKVEKKNLMSVWKPVQYPMSFESGGSVTCNHHCFHCMKMTT